MNWNGAQILIRWLFVTTAMALLLAGCGRTELQSACDSDQDCEEGWSCAAGICSDDDSDEPDVGGDTDVEDGCTTDLDCGDATCEAGGDGCVGDVCNVETGQCEVGSCTPECGAGEVEVGCNCVPETCQDSSECFGQICASGMCRPCASNAECTTEGATSCEDGMCVPGAECTGDDDCRPFEECSADQTCEERPECTFADDCGQDEQCIAGTCTYTPECTDDTDCSEQAECVGGHCQTKMCRGNSECPGDELCDAGECVPPPVALNCEVITEGQTIVPNQQISLEAFAYDAQGNGVAATFAWTSSDDSVAEIDGNDLVGNSVPGTATVSAVLQGGDPVACDGEPEFENLGLAPQDELRVRVQHMETGEPVQGAEVFVDDTMAVTSATGVADFADPGGTYDVSVFHDDFNYLTVRDVEADDIRLPISPRSGSGPVAGFTGDFDPSAISTSGDIELGIAGASLAGDLLDVNLERLLGDPFNTDFSVPGLGGTEVELPGGVSVHGQVLSFPVDGKQTYYAQSARGPRLAWGLVGEVPFSDLTGIFTDPPDDFASAIGEFLPLFSRFDHGQQSMVLQSRSRVLDVQDINNNGVTDEWLPDYDNFPEENLMPSVRQQLSTEVNISSLPVLDGEQSEVAVLLGGTQVELIGLVPLGISATSADTGGTQPEARTLYMAPPYGSAVGGRYTVMAISFAADGGGGLGGDFSVSLWNGENLSTSTSLGTFPDSSTGTINDNSRSIDIDASAGPMFRVRMEDSQRSWDIWSLGPDGVAGEYSHTITLPEPPGSWSDLFENDATIYVDAIRTNVNVDDLVRSTGVGLHRAGLVTTSFNRTTFR